MMSHELSTPIRIRETSKLVILIIIMKGKISFRIPLIFSISRNLRIGLSGPSGRSASVFLANEFQLNNPHIHCPCRGISRPRPPSSDGSVVVEIPLMSFLPIVGIFFLGLDNKFDNFRGILSSLGSVLDLSWYLWCTHLILIS